MSVFLKIARFWEIEEAEQVILLGVSEAEFSRLVTMVFGGDDVPLSEETEARIDLIGEIFGTLHILLSNEESANTWVKRPNTSPLFGGAPALARMLSGKIEDLEVVRDYLSSALHGW